MTTQLPRTVASYIEATNAHDAARFIALFADGAVVDDAGREFRGIASIKAWSQHDIFDAQVTLDVVDVAERDGETVVTSQVDGNFDRNGLPDPLFIDHHIKVAGDKIVGLTCRLAANEPRTLPAAKAPLA